MDFFFRNCVVSLYRSGVIQPNKAQMFVFLCADPMAASWAPKKFSILRILIFFKIGSFLYNNVKPQNFVKEWFYEPAMGGNDVPLDLEI